MNYKGGDLVRVKTIKEMFETPGFNNIIRYGMLDHRTETCSWDMVNEYQLQRDYPARIVKLSYNTGTIWVVEEENFVLGEWMIADGHPQFVEDLKEVQREKTQAVEGDVQPDRLTQLEDRINDYEEGYRQCDRCTTDLREQVITVERGQIALAGNMTNFWKKQRELEDRLVLLTRSIERTTDISGRF